MVVKIVKITLIRAESEEIFSVTKSSYIYMLLSKNGLTLFSKKFKFML